MTRTWIGWSLVVSVALAIAAGGCEAFDRAERNARREVKQATDSAARKVERGASEVARTVSSKVSGELAKTADSLGARVEVAARDAGHEVSGAIKAADVKTALVAASGLEATRIEVDADAKTRTLRLRGSVPRASLRDSLEQIARARAGDYTVHSELSVSSR